MKKNLSKKSKKSLEKKPENPKWDPKAKSPKDPKAKSPKEDLPKFPDKEEKDFGPGIEEPEGELEQPELEEICRDLVSVPFEIWNILRPEIDPLSDTEKRMIAKPLARVAQKYDVQKYMKDEILLAGLLGYSIIKRTRIKKIDTNDNRKERKGKDNSSEKFDSGLTGSQNIYT